MTQQETDQPGYLTFWGKAGGVRTGEPAWHPLAYHSLDVAAVADVLLRANPRRLAAFAGLLGTTIDSARAFLVALIALHDLGKFAAPFQAKCESAYPPVLGQWQSPSAAAHDEIGSAIRDALELAGQFTPDWSRTDFDELWHAVVGHHGRPRVVSYPPRNPPQLPSASRAAATAFVHDVMALFPQATVTNLPEQRALALLSWSIVGLTVVSDWIGSNRDWFGYREPDLTLSQYWQNALTKAEAAVTKAGVRPAAPAKEMSATQLLPAYIANALSPLQRLLEAVPLPEGPMLAIIEDVTGSGKTEGALLLAARLLDRGSADGIFFALPTMATANAMFERVGTTYRQLFSDAASPSLVLAHGRRALNKGFTDSILGANDITEKVIEGYPDGGAAACVAWIADDRRKAFLAHVGVGTIDQALLGVLPSKYQSLRLWGLGDRVLIVDEAHAYDAYMSREIETLIEFHVALGGSAIVLSATLAQAQRRGLASAYAKGLGVPAPATVTAAYPLVTIVGRNLAAAHPVPARLDRKRRLPVRRIASVDAALAHVETMSKAGAAVAWIRNAVDDAIEASELLRARGLDPVLLHSRFAMGDRLAIEHEVTSTLGRVDKTGKRHGLIVVGTQILEQSLDYDVDAMITDLAPIDLMIQRAGRLWRHATHGPRPVDAPELLVLSPDAADVRDANWYRTISKRAAAVYDHHGVVWRSAKVLFEAGCIDTPDGVRDLIERVYGEDSNLEVPAPLLAQSQKAEGQRSAARSFARTNLLELESGYAGGSETLWTKDTITPTRLGQPVTTFRLGRMEVGYIVPWCRADDGDPGRSWALSEVSLAQRHATGVPEPDREMALLVKAAKDNWPEWEKEQPLLVLEPDGGKWGGIVTKEGDGDKRVSYQKHLGLRIIGA